MRAFVVAGLAFALGGCIGSSAEWRPAKGSSDLPAQKTAYRVQTDPGCTHIGFVTQARSIEQLGDTVAEHGGTHFVVLDDFSDKTIETESSGTRAVSSSTSREVVRHAYTADAYLCGR